MGLTAAGRGVLGGRRSPSIRRSPIMNWRNEKRALAFLSQLCQYDVRQSTRVSTLREVEPRNQLVAGPAWLARASSVGKDLGCIPSQSMPRVNLPVGRLFLARFGFPLDSWHPVVKSDKQACTTTLHAYFPGG
jgi:hypothetical protein